VSDRRVPVAVALGSNLGNREAYLAFAVDRLRHLFRFLRASTWHETEPVDVYGDQGLFLNGVVVGMTELGPQALLKALLGIERECGRERPHPGAARTLDLDLILYGNSVIDEPGLVVPHPRFRERRFVLEPLAEVAGEWIDPMTGRSINALLRRLPPDPS
jgi:2-amino-4-hydroxy-6-hydroxymethyldihydropteridine diphosphokinase